MTSQRRLGLLFVLVGPPGVGKNTMMNTVLGQLNDLKQLPTATTRSPRPTEQQGREHLFVTHEEFERMNQAHELLEQQEVHGEWYGMPKLTVEKAITEEEDLIADIDVKGAAYLRIIYPDNAVLIFIQPSSIDDLKAQMQNRGETTQEIEKRMRRVDMEMQYAPLCDYLITNEKGNVEKASEILHGIILAERSHRALLNLRAGRDLPRRKFTYISAVVPLCGDEILYHSTLPHFPSAALTHGEFPHDAALRAFQQDLGITGTSQNLFLSGDWSADNFIVPLSLENQVEEHHQQITFYYLYRLDTRIMPPQGWDWISYQQISLPDTIVSAIRTLIGDVPTSRSLESSHEPA